jgi:hypothetical protein
MAQTAAMIVVPALIARGGVGGMAAPLLALLGYGIYRENRPAGRTTRTSPALSRKSGLGTVAGRLLDGGN